MADGSERASYGAGGPASGESLEAETAPQAHREDTGSQDGTD